jgi:hypothetical protein
VSYRAQVATAFEVLAEGLAPFVDERMSRTYPDEDWILMAANKLGKRRDVLVSITDPHFQLEVLNRWWGPAFAAVLPDDVRQTMTDLRTARNHWAHPDEDHPIDLAYAMRVHEQSEELLRAIGAEEAEQMVQLVEDLRWDGVRAAARQEGVTEADALMLQLAELQGQYGSLQQQLEAARLAAESATGRSRAVARQLAELQSQYAAVSGLRDDYLALQRQLEEAGGPTDGDDGPPSELRQQLASAEMALVGLQRESLLLRQQLAETRTSMAKLDPLETEAGRRWVWLVASLVVTLSILVVLAAYLPR